MKLIIISMLVALMALGTSCAQISQPVAEVAPQGTSDGIQVHGHWTVTVTNLDGTVDAVHEFENALSEYGSDVLTSVILGEADITDFELMISQSKNWIKYALVCDESLYGTVQQSIDKIALAKTRNFYANGSPISLTGLCTVDTTSGILKDKVEIQHLTTLVKLDKHISINDDPQLAERGAGMSIALTSHDLDAPLELANDQTVAFNIVISFE